MKHIAQITMEFLKTATSWDLLSLDTQKKYLKKHPKSKRKLTNKPAKTAPQEETKTQKLAKDIYTILAKRTQDNIEKTKTTDPDDIYHIYDHRFLKNANPQDVKEVTEEIAQWIEDDFELGEKDLKPAEEMANDWENLEPTNLDGFINNFS